MARSQITVTDIARSGTAPISQTTADASNKHYFVNDGMTYLEIVSTDAGSQTVTVKVNPSYTADSLVVNDLTITIPAGTTRLAGPFKVYTFKQDSSNDAYVDPSVSTTLKFRAWRLTPA